MIININLATNNAIYYYNVEKNKATKEYNICVYRNVSTQEQKIFPVLKDIIIAKEKISTEFFIDKLNKISKCEIANTKSFGQSAKQVVSLINSYIYTISSSRQPLILSILYLDGKPLPKIEKICLIDNNMYFVTKYKKEYIMREINNENMECMIPLSNIFNLYKRLKKANYMKKNIKRKSGRKTCHNPFSNIRTEELAQSVRGIQFSRELIETIPIRQTANPVPPTIEQIEVGTDEQTAEPIRESLTETYTLSNPSNRDNISFCYDIETPIRHDQFDRAVAFGESEREAILHDALSRRGTTLHNTSGVERRNCLLDEGENVLQVEREASAQEERADATLIYEEIALDNLDSD